MNGAKQPNGDLVWDKLHSLSPASVTALYWDGNDQQDLLVDFAPYGLFRWMNNQKWESLHNLSPKAVAVGDIDGKRGLLHVRHGKGDRARYTNP